MGRVGLEGVVGMVGFVRVGAGVVESCVEVVGVGVVGSDGVDGSVGVVGSAGVVASLGAGGYFCDRFRLFIVFCLLLCLIQWFAAIV